MTPVNKTEIRISFPSAPPIPTPPPPKNSSRNSRQTRSKPSSITALVFINRASTLELRQIYAFLRYRRGYKTAIINRRSDLVVKLYTHTYIYITVWSSHRDAYHLLRVTLPTFSNACQTSSAAHSRGEADSKALAGPYRVPNRKKKFGAVGCSESGNMVVLILNSTVIL